MRSPLDGLRAGARRAGSANPVRPIPERYVESHYPKTQPYGKENVLADLLEMAASRLVPYGRLVFWLSTDYSFSEKDRPSHPKLRYIGDSEQGLTRKTARRLITMEKRP